MLVHHLGELGPQRDAGALVSYRTGWRFSLEDNPDPNDPDDWATHTEQKYRVVRGGWVSVEVSHSDHEDAASSYDWQGHCPDLFMEDATIRNGFEVWVKSPEGEVKKLHVSVEFEPTYTASEVSE